MLTYYIVIRYANPGLEDLYAAKADGYYAYDNGDGMMTIEKQYEGLDEVYDDLEGTYGSIIAAAPVEEF